MTSFIVVILWVKQKGEQIFSIWKNKWFTLRWLQALAFRVLERSFRFVVLIYLYILSPRHARTSWQWRIWMVARSPSVTAEFSAHSLAHPSSTHHSRPFWACMVSLTGQWLLVARLVIRVFCFSLAYLSDVCAFGIFSASQCVSLFLSLSLN